MPATVRTIYIVIASCVIITVFGAAIETKPAHAETVLGPTFNRIAYSLGLATRRTARGVIKVTRHVGRRARRIATAVVVRPARQVLRVAGEVVAVGIGQDELARLKSLGYVVKRRSNSNVLGKSVTRFEIPKASTLDKAKQEIRGIAPSSATVSNALYYRMALTSYKPSGEPCGSRCEVFELTKWQPTASACLAKNTTIGVIDTRIDTAHPSILGANVTVRTTRATDRQPSSSDHGTGVVSLLVGRQGSEVHGISQEAKIFAVDAFHSNGDHDAADVYDLVLAIELLIEQGVKVINLSISGPANPILKQAIDHALDMGITIVAAAGKPETNALGYPGRYPGVVAVSSVNGRLLPSHLSLRGKHIAFAAPGVGLTVAGADNATIKVDGTSFAAPFVAAAFAMTPGETHKDRELILRRSAKDLGAPGKDPIYGWGLIQFPSSEACNG